ncbi:hypothetical protein ACFVQ4_29360 [Streptomyces laurentii]
MQGPAASKRVLLELTDIESPIDRTLSGTTNICSRLSPTKPDW